jgi:uncharacterized LabA/DUF88 family protein
MKTTVYVDGLNLYYSALRGTPFKWLDLYALFRDHVLDTNAGLEQVRYYTAPVKGSSSDDPCSPQRQQRYLAALETYHGSRIQIVQGFIARSTPFLRLVTTGKRCASPTKVQVFHFMEKQTDVNLAADLISDAWRNRFSQAVICSNDSDLVGALAAVRRDHPNVILGLVAPVRELRLVSSELKDQAAWCKTVDMTHLAKSQLPDRIPGTRFTRPIEWSDAAANLEVIREPVLPPNAA